MSISQVHPDFTPETKTDSTTPTNWDDKLTISVDERGRALRDLFDQSPPPDWVKNGVQLANGHWQMQLTLQESLDLLLRLDANMNQSVKDFGTIDDYIGHIWDEICKALGEYR